MLGIYLPTRWFNSWPFDPLCGGHEKAIEEGHVNSPSEKGHVCRIARYIWLVFIGKMYFLLEKMVVFIAMFFLIGSMHGIFTSNLL